MKRIIETAEAGSGNHDRRINPFQGSTTSISDAVTRSAANLAESLSAKYIVVYTESGYTARLVSKHRPRCTILGLSRHKRVCQRMKLLWGVRAKTIKQVADIDDLVKVVESMLVRLKWVQKGDLICVIAGTPFQVAGKTDLIKLHTIGEDTPAVLGDAS
jgi:pyruvate kinase